ncbi:MAG: sigma-70 family RNA polymerase sigma factor [Candidatus Solibacter sp.]
MWSAQLWHGPDGQAWFAIAGQNAVLRFPLKPCNLSLCWYALQIGSSAISGCRANARCGMLVDFEVIRRAQKGDAAAFNEMVLAYRKRILGTITRLIARPEDVEDVAQEVFVRLYFSLDQLRTPEVFEPWLHRLTVNAAYDYLRKQRRRQEFRMSDLSEQQVMLADAMAGGKVEKDETHQKKVRESVDSLLGAVSEADRILLMLKEVEGLSLKELEKVYKVNENALKVRLFRARQRVLKAFGSGKKEGAG